MKILPLLTVAVAAPVELCRILVMFGVDIWLTSWPTLLDRVLDIRLCGLNIPTDLRAIGAFALRTQYRRVLEPQLLSRITDQSLVY